MGKLVLFLADGTTLDIRLDRERITIGRRADNDVCLPYPAVSAEHAAVVTILADSFLEDLGSTNGTLVNGMPVAKHFLRDRDQIDIGRQQLVYVHDESTTIESPRQTGRGETQTMDDRLPNAAVGPAAAPALVADPAPHAVPAPSAPPDPAAGVPPHDVERFVAAELAADARGGDRHAERDAPAPDPGTKTTAPVSVASIRVLTGPNAGRTVALTRPVTSIGRVGLQVAAIRRDGAECRLVPVEGDLPPRVNGAPVDADGVILRAGDLVEIAGARLEFQTVADRSPRVTPAARDAAASPK